MRTAIRSGISWWLGLAACVALGFGISSLAVAAELPTHRPLRILIVSDEVNPHGLPPEQLTQPGELAAALTAAGAGLELAADPESVLEIGTDQIELATAALQAATPGTPDAYDVLIYFAHRIPNGGIDPQARQETFVAAVEAFLQNGGGVVSFHHGVYETAGKVSMQQLLGATAVGSVVWNDFEGQNVIAVAPEHFIACHAVSYDGTISYADAARGIPASSYPAFNNTPDERYLNFELNSGPGTGALQILFASDFVQSGTTHLLGYTHRRAEWRGMVAAYQPGEHQPTALDPSGDNFQILANAILYVSGRIPEDGIRLDLAPGLGSGDVALSWEGCEGTRRVFRSATPQTVTDAANELGSTSAGSWDDAPPAGSIWFYRVVR